MGAAAAVIAIGSMVPYIRDIARGRTKPHLFSWLVWTAITIGAFTAQVTGGGGPGAWATGCLATLNVVVLVMSVARGEKRRTVFDRVSLCGCGAAGVLWLTTRDPLWSVVLITLIDVLAYVPTWIKSWSKPQEETLSSHMCTAVAYALSMVALTRFTVVTALYPSSLLVADLILIGVLAGRRRVFPRGNQGVTMA